MKNSKQILAQIRKNREQIEKLREQIKAAKWSEKTAPDVVKAAELEQVLMVENMLLKDNARRAYVAEVLPGVLGILNRYAGKACGEKTREKMREEAKSRFSCSFYITQGYSGELSIVPLDAKGYSGTDWNYKDFEFSTKEILTNDNKVVAVSAEQIYLQNCGEYCEQPRKRAAQILNRYAALKKRQEETEAAFREFNSLLPSRIDPIFSHPSRYYLFNA